MSDAELTNLLLQAAAGYRSEHVDLPVLQVAGIRRDGDHFYVAVRPTPRPARTYPYYDHLAQLERLLLDEHHVDVLLVPARAA